MPEISIIIPCYKTEKYLPQCLDSVLKQTFNDYEVICIDDGSPDKCAEILKAYARKDSRIKVLSQQNQGLSMARNNGLKQARGKYVYFLDSDDFIHPQCLEIAHTLARRQQADMVSFNYCKNAGGHPLYQHYQINDIPVFTTEEPFYHAVSKVTRYKIHCTVWTKLFKKSLLEGTEFIPKIQYEDYPYVFAILAKRPKTAIIETTLYFQSINMESITHQAANPRQISFYHQGINFLYAIYSRPDMKKELSVFKEKVIPSLLRGQLRLCARSAVAERLPMYRTFAAELRDLKHKGMLARKGHKLWHYITCKYLIWRYKA